MKSAVAFQAHTAQAEIFCRAYWPAVMKPTCWKSGFCWEPNSAGIGCKLWIDELVVMVRPESPAGNNGTDDAIKGEVSPGADGALAVSPARDVPSGRSAITTPIRSRRHRLVANPPIIPG